MTEPLMLIAKVTVLLAIALFAAHLLRRRAATLAHALWTTTFATLLLLPFAGGVLPSLVVPVLPSSEAAPGNHAAPESLSAPTAPSGAGAFLPQQLPLETESSLDVVVAAPVAQHSTGNPARMWPLSVVALTVWASGAAASAAALLLAFARARRMTTGATPIHDGVWPTGIDRIARRLGIRRTVQLLMSPQISVPMTTGLWRPSILLPEVASGWDAQRRDIVLAHELAHVAAFDPLRLLIVRLASAIYWFHPLIWLSGRRSRAACERACDEAVVGLGVPRSTYAAELMALVHPAPALAGAATVPMAQRSGLEDRLTHILTTKARPARRYTSKVVGMSMVLASVTIAAIELTAADPDRADALATNLRLVGPAPEPEERTTTDAAANVATPTGQVSTPATPTAAPTSLRGRVIDGATGEGLPGASLSMRCYGTTMYGRDLITNDRGEFTINDLGDDQCMAMVAHREGYTRDLSEMRYLEASDAVHVLHFWSLGNISGRAVHPSGAPAVGVPVDILAQPAGSSRGWVSAGPATSTDEDGRFHFPARQTQRRYRLVARTLGASIEVDLPPGQSRSDIELRGGAREVFSVAGRVVQDDASSWPLNVRLLSDDGVVAIGPVAADPSGAFAFAGVPAGTYDIHAQPSGSLSPQFPIPVFSSRVVVNDHVDDVVVVAVRATTLRVELEYDGDPSRGRVLLGLDRLDAPAGTQSSRMLQVGGTTFTVDGLVAGRYAFRATGVPTGYTVTRVVANGRDVTAEGFDPVAVTGPVVVTLSNRLATVEGRVLTPAGSEAPASTVVVLAAGQTTRVVRIVQATQRGRFAVANLTPGEYAVVAVKSAELPAGLAFSLPSAADPALAGRILPHAVRVSLAAHETTRVELREAAVDSR